MRTLALAVMLVMLAPAAGTAQSLPDNARVMLRDYAKSRDPLDLAGAIGMDVVTAYTIEKLKTPPKPTGLSSLRTDLHLGSAGAGGSTSILARSAATDLLSAAFESGAVVRKADDKAVTLTVNALPIQQIMAGQAPRGCGAADETCRTGIGRWLRGLSASMTFSTSNATRPVEGLVPNAPLAFLTGGRAIQGWTARYEGFVRERESQKQQDALKSAAKTLSEKAAEAFLSVAGPAISKLGVLLPNWARDTQVALETEAESQKNATPEERFRALEPILIARLEVAAEVASAIPELKTALIDTGSARETYTEEVNKVLAEKLYRKALTFDYANVRPTDQPAFHQVKLVWSTPLGKIPKKVALAAEVVPSGTVTANGGVSWFKPKVADANTWRVRDTQLSIGLDWSPAAWGASRPIYTIAYYFQYMHEDGVLQFTGDALVPGGAKIPLPASAKTLLNTKGAIHVAQLRISVPVGNGVRFPAAVSYSNRTELITGRGFWQGHLGVSYDFSSLKEQLRRD